MNTKQIDLSKSVLSLCETNPELQKILAELGFQDIMMPGMLSTVGRFMTIPKGAMVKRIDINVIKDTLRANGYEILE